MFFLDCMENTSPMITKNKDLVQFFMSGLNGVTGNSGQNSSALSTARCTPAFTGRPTMDVENQNINMLPISTSSVSTCTLTASQVTTRSLIADQILAYDFKFDGDLIVNSVVTTSITSTNATFDNLVVTGW